MARTNTPRRSAHDWALAGFEAFVESGIDGIAVERVAERLETTKGSFYWHYENRDALVAAVLELWTLETERIIERLEAISDPRDRLKRLFGGVLMNLSNDRSEIDLLHRADVPAVRGVLDAVSARRISFIERAFVDAGVRGIHARNRAIETYALWIGLLQLNVAVPSALPSTQASRRRLIRSTITLIEGLLPDPHETISRSA